MTTDTAPDNIFAPNYFSTPRRPLHEHLRFDDRPEISVDEMDLKVSTPRAWDILSSANAIAPHLFVCGDEPVRIEHGEDDRLLLRPLTPDRLTHAIAQVVAFTKTGARNNIYTVPPPKPLIQDMLATPEPPLPVLRRIVSAPVFAPDGSLPSAPGYHEAGRVYYDPAPSFVVPDVPEQPTEADITRAVALVDELLLDFPLPAASDRAHVFALFLLPFVRDLIDGCTPLHLLKAPMPRSGKTLLMRALLCPALGRSPAMMPQVHQEEEVRRSLFAALRGLPMALCIDNVSDDLDSGTLAYALTADEFSDRVLRASELGRVPVRCVWTATANNPVLSEEIALRSVPIDLLPNFESPLDRDPATFKHPDLLAWVAEQRSELVWAALTLGRAGMEHAATYQGRTLSGYEAWSRVIGGILQAAKVPGFLENREFYETVDPQVEGLRALVEVWATRYGSTKVGARDLYDLALRIEDIPTGTTKDRSSVIAFGKYLRRHKNRVVNGYKIVDAGSVRRVQQWELRPMKT